MNELLEKWISPAGILVLFGGVVWGVQLNVATMNLTKQMSGLSGKTDELSHEMSEIAQNNVRTSMILSALTKDIDRALEHTEEHERDSEDWKRRIMLNEQRLKDMHK